MDPHRHLTPLPGEVTGRTTSPPEYVGDTPGTAIDIAVTNPNDRAVVYVTPLAPDHSSPYSDLLGEDEEGSG